MCLRNISEKIALAISTKTFDNETVVHYHLCLKTMALVADHFFEYTIATFVVTTVQV